MRLRIISIIYFALIASIGFFPIPSNPLPIDSKGYHWLLWGIINSVLLLILFVKSRKENLKIPKSPSLISFIIFFLIAGLSSIVAINRVESLVKLTDVFVVMSSLIIVYYIIVNRLIDFGVLLWIVFFKLLIEVIAGYYQLYNLTSGFQYDFTSNLSAYLKSFYGNKNVTSFALLIQSTISMILFWKLKSKPLKIFVAILILSTFYLLLFISTRGVFVSILLMLALLILVMFLKYKYDKKIDLNEIKKVGLYVLFIAIPYLIFNLNYSEKSLDIADRTISVSQIDGESVSSRLRYWSHAISSIVKNPITGIGIGNWKIYSIKYDSENIFSYVIPYSTHNDFLEIFAETGFFGFLSYFLFFFFIFKKSFANLIQWIKSNANHYHVYMFFCLMFFLIDINLNFPLSRPLMQIILILFITAFETLNYHEKQE